jgi:hypothetical protein
MTTENVDVGGNAFLVRQKIAIVPASGTQPLVGIDVNGNPTQSSIVPRSTLGAPPKRTAVEQVQVAAELSAKRANAERARLAASPVDVVVLIERLTARVDALEGQIRPTPISGSKPRRTPPTDPGRNTPPRAA